MKTFLKIAIALVAVSGLICLCRANDLDTIRVNSWLGGSNCTAIANNSTASAQIAQPITNGSVRIAVEVNNTNITLGVALKFGSAFTTSILSNQADVIVGPGQNRIFLFGEGYNGQVSARSTNGTAVGFIYNEQYR